VGGEGNGQRLGPGGRTRQQAAPGGGADGEPDQQLEERGGGGKGARMAGGGGGERGEEQQQGAEDAEAQRQARQGQEAEEAGGGRAVGGAAAGGNGRGPRPAGCPWSRAAARGGDSRARRAAIRARPAGSGPGSCSSSFLSSVIPIRVSPTPAGGNPIVSGAVQTHVQNSRSKDAAVSAAFVKLDTTTVGHDKRMLHG